MSEQPPPDRPTQPGGSPPPPPRSPASYPQQGPPPPAGYAAQPPPPAHLQPGYGQPGYQPGYPPPGAYRRPQKKRPKAWWFFVGGFLMLAGIGIGVALFVNAFVSATEQDGVVTADGRPATINAPAGEKRMLFVRSDQRAPSCDLVDGTGKKLLLRPIFDAPTLNIGGTKWLEFSQVDSSGDGRVTLTCTPTTSGGGSQVQVRMGAPVDVRALGGGVIGGFAAILLLGGAGFVILLVTTILWFSRKPAPQV